MKKSIKLCCVLVMSGIVVMGCGNQDAELEKLKKENTQLKEQMASGEAAKNADVSAVPETVPVPTEEVPAPAPTVKKLTKKERYKQYAEKIKVKVYNKKVLPTNLDIGRYSDFIEIDYKVVNKSPKAIKGIKGTLGIYDQFNEWIMDINWDVSDGKISAGKTRKITSYGIEYNQFMDEHNKLHRLKFEDLIFKYKMEQVNFADGYKLKF